MKKSQSIICGPSTNPYVLWHIILLLLCPMLYSLCLQHTFPNSSTPPDDRYTLRSLYRLPFGSPLLLCPRGCFWFLLILLYSSLTLYLRCLTSGMVFLPSSSSQYPRSFHFPFCDIIVPYLHTFLSGFVGLHRYFVAFPSSDGLGEGYL